MIEPERICRLNDKDVDRNGRYVVYWMQQSQREPMNAALEYAAAQANALDVPLVVAFGLDPEYPDANERHYTFMLEGLAETARRLADRGIKMVARFGSPPDVANSIADRAALLVCDRGYLRHQHSWRQRVATQASIRVEQVEADVIVPVEIASDKREWAARTLRKKLDNLTDRFITPVNPVSVDKESLRLRVRGDFDLRDGAAILKKLDIDRTVGAVSRFEGGTRAARSRLTGFLRSGLPGYADARNDPAEPQASELSPYLHFGQISPAEIALKTRRASGPSDNDKQAFLEELIVRRELACNFVHFTPDYDSYQCLPDWAKQTLAEHRNDARPTRYTRQQLEQAQTDDAYWNAAMREMLDTGYMHNYMRMYWGKKIIEWSNTPEYAYATALYLNNKYFLDGRDPNSYSNVAWLFGLHDQGWAEREIFGKVRYMNAAGLKRKFDIEAYVRKWCEPST